MKPTPCLKVLAFILGFAATVASAAPLKIGFAQTGAESAWRTANSESMKAEAAKRGIDLKFSDGQGKQENQIRALRSTMMGVDMSGFEQRSRGAIGRFLDTTQLARINASAYDLMAEQQKIWRELSRT